MNEQIAGGVDERRDERLARVTLNLVTEPGHPLLARTVGRFGAQRTVQMLGERTDGPLEDRELATRLADVEPERVLEEAGRSVPGS